MDNGPIQAYAKLEGDNFCYYIKTLQVILGRKTSGSDQVEIHLGSTKAISRQHARLYYNFQEQRFELMIFGKNGAYINEVFCEKGVTVPLENRYSFILSLVPILNIGFNYNFKVHERVISYLHCVMYITLTKYLT